MHEKKKSSKKQSKGNKRTREEARMAGGRAEVVESDLAGTMAKITSGYRS